MLRRRFNSLGGTLFLSVVWMGLHPSLGLALDYENDVRPILKRRCLKCHNLDEREADLDLSSFDGVMLGSNSGPVVSPGDPEDSFLWITISHIEEPFMPPNADPIPEEERRLVRDWIAGGALREGESETPPLAQVTPPATPSETVGAGASNTITALATNWERGWLAHATSQGIRLEPSNGQEAARILPFAVDQIHDLRFSNDGATLWAAGGIPGESGTVVRWDLESGATMGSFGDELDTVLAMDVTRDQRWLAYGGPDRRVKLQNLRAANARPVIIRKHTDFVLDLAFSPDGLLLASADRAGNLFVWVTETQALFATLRGKIGSVEALVWNEASDHLSATGSNGEIVTWDLRALESPKRRWLAHEGGALDLQLGPNDTLLSAGRDGWVRLWRRDATPLEAWDCESVLPTQAQLVYRDTAWRVAAGTLEGTIEWFDGSRLPAPRAHEPRRIAPGFAVESSENRQLKDQIDTMRHAYRDFREAQAIVESLRSELSTIEGDVDQWTTVQAGLQQAKTGLESLRSTDEDERALDTLVLAKLANERAQAILDGKKDNQSAVLRQLAEAERNRESAQANWRTLMDAIENDSPEALSASSLKD